MNNKYTIIKQESIEELSLNEVMVDSLMIRNVKHLTDTGKVEYVLDSVIEEICGEEKVSRVKIKNVLIIFPLHPTPYIYFHLFSFIFIRLRFSSKNYRFLILIFT